MAKAVNRLREVRTTVDIHNQRILLPFLIIGRQDKSTVKWGSVDAVPIDDTARPKCYAIQLGINVRDAPSIGETGIRNPNILGMLGVLRRVSHGFTVTTN